LSEGGKKEEGFRGIQRGGKRAKKTKACSPSSVQGEKKTQFWRGSQRQGGEKKKV